MENNSPTPKLEEMATPDNQEPISQNEGTAQEQINASEQIKQGDTDVNQDNFTSIDVKTLSPELKSKYDAMLTDYKRKTTEVAQKRKEIEQQHKEIQDVISNPDFQRAYNALSTSQQQEIRQDIGVTEEEFNKAFESKENFSGFVQKIAQKASAQNEQQVIDLKANLMLKEFKSSHPDFDKLNKNQLITYQLKTDPRAQTKDERLWSAALNDAYQNASRVYNEIIEEGKKQGYERVKQKAAMSSEPPTGSVSQVNNFGDPKNWTTAQAIAAAKAGIRVQINS